MAKTRRVKVFKGSITKEIYEDELTLYIADGWKELKIYNSNNTNNNTLFNKIK